MCIIYIYIYTNITLHYIALHCITLHYIALHCITLHYNTYLPVSCIRAWQVVRQVPKVQVQYVEKKAGMESCPFPTGSLIERMGYPHSTTFNNQ